MSTQCPYDPHSEHLFENSVYERLFVSTPKANICSTNRCLTTIERLYDVRMTGKGMTARQRQILEFIEAQIQDHGYPPSVREIGDAVGLTSPSTVHTHLNTLTRLGYLRRDPTKPRAIEVTWDPSSGVAMERRPMRHVPLIGDVAAGTDVLAQKMLKRCTRYHSTSQAMANCSCLAFAAIQ